MSLLTSEDVVVLRQSVSALMREQHFSIVEQTKMITACSELARNTVVYGGGGQALCEILVDMARSGIRVTFEDQGPGIADIERAMADGYTTGGGMGLGLGGARRLVNEFDIRSAPGAGTRVTVTRWKCL